MPIDPQEERELFDLAAEEALDNDISTSIDELIEPMSVEEMKRAGMLVKKETCRKSIQQKIEALAEKNNITVLSDIYQLDPYADKEKTPIMLDIQCNVCGHEYRKQFQTFRQAPHCSECKKRKHKLERLGRGSYHYLLTIVKTWGGKIVNKDQFEGKYKDPIYLKCKKGHAFETNLHRLRAGQWCPACTNSAEKKAKVVGLFSHGRSNRDRHLYYVTIAKSKGVFIDEKDKWPGVKGIYEGQCERCGEILSLSPKTIKANKELCYVCRREDYRKKKLAKIMGD